MNSAIILYISIITPIFLLAFIVKKELRTVFLFYIFGATVCLICGEIDGFILKSSQMSRYAMTINITPLIEELLKAIPIFFIALVLKCKSETVFKSGISLGVGFAVLETVLVFTENLSNVDIGWAIMRGLGAGLVHSLSGLMISFAICKARNSKILILPVSIATMSTAILFHSLYNLLVQSTFPYLALMLTIFVYLVLLMIYYFRYKNGKEKIPNDTR